MRVARWLVFAFISVAGLKTVASGNADEPSLARIQQILSQKRMVDLTHAFEPGIPKWPGFPDEKRETVYWYEKGRGSMGEVWLADLGATRGHEQAGRRPVLVFSIDDFNSGPANLVVVLPLTSKFRGVPNFFRYSGEA